jgi:hypothetical protein
VPERQMMAEALGEAAGQLLDEERRDVMRAHATKSAIEVATLGSEAAELRAALAEARARAIGVDPAAVARRVN